MQYEITVTSTLNGEVISTHTITATPEEMVDIVSTLGSLCCALFGPVCLSVVPLCQN
jgi:hypothetical protein